MSKTADRCNHRVDSFVAAVNLSPREPLFAEEIPEPCRLPESEWPDAFHWQVVPSAEARWLSEVEARLSFQLPPTFRSLIARYVFPSFEVGPLTLYSVGVSEPDESGMEFRLAIFKDPFMSPFLFKNRLMPFARPADWSYDPVCFDFRSPNRKSEPAVLRIDHEEILCNERLRVVETISPAFHELMEELTLQLQKKRVTNS
jgi:hypothetical protein